MSTFLGMPVHADRSTGHVEGARRFPDAARTALADEQLRAHLGNATHTIRTNRVAVVAGVPDWEELREAGRAIKADTMARLPELLTQLEEKV